MRLSDRSANREVSAVDPWSPVRRAALADAHAEADRVRARARTRSDAAVAAARERAGALREDLLAEARRAADDDARRTLSAARRSAHGMLLSARRDVYTAIAREIAERSLTHRGDYQAITERLIRDAHRRLGENVEISDAPDGGIIAHAPGRQIDYSLATQVGRCLAQLDDEVAALWS